MSNVYTIDRWVYEDTEATKTRLPRKPIFNALDVWKRIRALQNAQLAETEVRNFWALKGNYTYLDLVECFRGTTLESEGIVALLSRLPLEINILQVNGYSITKLLPIFGDMLLEKRFNSWTRPLIKARRLSCPLSVLIDFSHHHKLLCPLNGAELLEYISNPNRQS